MKLLKKCPVCSGKLREKDVEKFLRSNGNIAVLEVKADVCVNCNVRLYAPKVILQFAEVKKKLKKGQIKDFTLIGKSYKVA